MKKLFFLSALFLSCISIAFASPNFSGTWTGYITQKSAIAIASNYRFNIYLQVNGEEVSGHSEIRMWDEPDVFAEMALEGTIDENNIVLKETEITKEKIYSYAYWCMKTLNMTYSIENGKEVLRGNWASELCSGPGEIYLEREPLL